MSLFHVLSRKAQLSIVQPEDFTWFYEQTYLCVFRYVMVLCAGNQAEAEDITADAFFRAWEKRQQFSGSSSAALGWVITIARNILIDHHRAERPRHVEMNLEEEVPEQGNNLEDILIDIEQFQQLLDAVQSLPFPQGDIVALRYALGWRVRAIADHLGLAENTVSVHLRRALAKLQRKLGIHETIVRRSIG